jgi:hypothetical protein
MKLTYFDVSGRADCIRNILFTAKQEFQDERVAQPDWPAIKQSGRFEFGSMPVLEISGKHYA